MIPSILVTAFTLAASGGEPVSSQTAQVPWYHGTFDQALEAAAKEDKAVFLYCWSQQSESCSKFQESTLTDEQAIASLEGYLCVGANVAAEDGRALIDHFGVTVLPTMLVIQPDGKAEDGILGLIDAGGFVAEMDRIGRGEGTVSALQQEVKALGRTKDLEAAVEARFKLLGKLTDVGRREEADVTKHEIFKVDPKGKTLTGARVRMWDAMEACYAPMKEEGADEHAKPDFSSVEKFAAKNKHRELRFEAWAWLSQQHDHQENYKDSRLAMMEAWDDVAEESAMDFGSKISAVLFEHREELSSKERKFAASLASQLRDGVDAQLAFMNEQREACACEGNEQCCGTDEDWEIYAQKHRAHWLDAAKHAFLAAGDKESADQCASLAHAG